MTYSNAFNASYGWEVVMIEMFETITPFLEDGSELLIYPDSDYDKLIVKNGKCIQVHQSGKICTLTRPIQQANGGIIMWKTYLASMIATYVDMKYGAARGSQRLEIRRDIMSITGMTEAEVIEMEKETDYIIFPEK